MCLNGVCLEPEIGSCTGKSELDSCSYSVFEDEEKCTKPRTGKGCEERGGTEYRDLYREEMSGSCKGALADSRKCAADASSVEAGSQSRAPIDTTLPKGTETSSSAQPTTRPPLPFFMPATAALGLSLWLWAALC